MNNDNPTADHVTDEAPASRGVEANLKSRNTWIRLVFMIVYYVILSIAGIVAGAVIVLSFLHVLFTGERNASLMQAGRTIARYVREILEYLTYNTDDKPFPFGRELPPAGSDQS